MARKSKKSLNKLILEEIGLAWEVDSEATISSILEEALDLYGQRIGPNNNWITYKALQNFNRIRKADAKKYKLQFKSTNL